MPLVAFYRCQAVTVNALTSQISSLGLKPEYKLLTEDGLEAFLSEGTATLQLLIVEITSEASEIAQALKGHLGATQKRLLILPRTMAAELPQYFNSGSVDYGAFSEDLSLQVLAPVFHWLFTDLKSVAHPEVVKPSHLRAPDTDRQRNSPVTNTEDKVFREMLTMEYIYDLIYGYPSRIESLKSLEGLYPLEASGHQVLLLMVDDFWKLCERLDNKQRYNLKRRILNVVRATLKGQSLPAITTSLIGTDKIIVLANFGHLPSDSQKSKAEALAQALCEAVSGQTRYALKVGLSDPCPVYQDLWKAYEKSFQALTHAFTYEKGVILHYDDLQEDKTLDRLLLSETDRFEYELTKSLSSARSGDKPEDPEVELRRILDNWCSFLIAQRYSEETIKSIFSKLIFNLLEYALQLGLDSRDLTKASVDTTVAILKSNALTGIRQAVQSYVTSLTDLIAKACQQGCSRGFEAAMAFIHTYYDKNLNLEEISRLANMSPYYFCRKFKDRYGVNYVKYLNTYRMEQSKALILDTDLSLSEIAVTVGIHDLSYFSKLFKSTVGQSPNQFRKSGGGSTAASEKTP